MEPACGVYQDEVSTHLLRALYGLEADAGRIGAALARDHGHIGTLRPDLQLLYGSCAEGVRGAQDDLPARLRSLVRYLAHRGGLARAIDADEQHDGLVPAEHLVPAAREGPLYLIAQQVEHRIGIGKSEAR